MKKYIFIKVLIVASVLGFNACGDWLDVIPEGVPTIDMAFNSRSQAIKYLATCYSYAPRTGSMDDPAMLGGDEIWTYFSVGYGDYRLSNIAGFYIALGQQNSTDPVFDSWGSLYQGLRDCNIFLENVNRVPDLPTRERDQWIAEVKTLKALYHFQLVKMYGPVPIIRENIPVSADVSSVKTVREPVDDSFQYMAELIDEATAGNQLPLNVFDVAGELGRITKPIALALKAKMMVTAASPLYNGNNDQTTLRNTDGTQLFNTTVDPAKWQRAVTACKEAIESCHEANLEMYQFPNSGLNRLTDTIATQMSLRNAYTLRYNSEIIWATWNNNRSTVRHMAPSLNAAYAANNQLRTVDCSVPLKIFNMFYTDKGVPLAEDQTRDIGKLYDLRTAKAEDKLYIKDGFVTADLNFDREPRYYAWLGFDGGIWYGAGRTDDKDDLYFTNLKNGGMDSPQQSIWRGLGSIPKKLIPYTNLLTGVSSYSHTSYPIPIMRLSDLYLLYAEAINEAEGPNGANSVELFEYIDRVRIHAGLKGVKESWDNYANNTKYNTQAGMREIIQQERMIELVFEGQRFWDIRRWKTAPNIYQTNILGWNTMEYEDVLYYQPVFVYKQSFGIRDYFWPIKNSDITQNPNLVQNIGW